MARDPDVTGQNKEQLPREKRWLLGVVLPSLCSLTTPEMLGESDHIFLEFGQLFFH